MRLHSVLEEKIWEKHESLVQGALHKLEVEVTRLGSSPSSTSERIETSILSFVTCSKHLASAAKIAWYMTMTSGDPIQQKRQNEERLKAELSLCMKSIIKISGRSLPKRSAQRLRRALRVELDTVSGESLLSFQALGDPLSNRIAKPVLSEGEASYNPRTKILFMTADYSRDSRGQRPGSALNLDSEYREIQSTLQASLYREQIDLVSYFATTPRDFLDALNRHKPQILHFGGHGGKSQGIMLQGSSGQAEPVGATFLAQTLSTVGDNLRVVVLNACHSEGQAKAILSAVPITVGTSSTLSDSAAIEFSGAFYGAISNGLAVSKAFQQAEALLTSVKRENRPQLLTQADTDADRMFLVRSSETADFEPLAQALNSSMQGFRKVDGRLGRILSKANAYHLLASNISAGPNLGLPIPEGAADNLERLHALLSDEVDRVDNFLRQLRQIGHTWGKFLNAGAVGRLAQLEQVVATTCESISEQRPLLETSIQRVVSVMREQNKLEGLILDEFVELTGALSTTWNLLSSGRRNASLYYNQLLEYLPGDLLKKGRIKAVEMAVPSLDELD